MKYDYKKMAEKHTRDMSKPYNENDPFGFIQEFDLNAYDRAYSDKDRKEQEANPFGKAKQYSEK